MALNEIYKCKYCGNMVQLVHVGGGTLVCCNHPMELLSENTTDASTEKHVPVLQAVDGGYHVAVGSVAHPMAEEHFIEWIEVLTDDGRVLRKHLRPGDAPEARFTVSAAGVTARAYCNLHGLCRS